MSPPFLVAAIAWLYSASHTKIAPGLTKHVIADCDGDLGFASYRYYKAFCKLNGIAPPRDQA